jgi:hypothetical protein
LARQAWARANEVELTKVPKNGGRRKKKGRGIKEKRGTRARPGDDRGLLSGTDCSWAPFSIFFWFFFLGGGSLGLAMVFGKMGVQHSKFLNLAPTLGSVTSSIPHGAWIFYFFPNFIFAKIRVHLDLHIHS